jgi:flagellar biosynthesis/type III secretory pathway protein FliH
MYNASLKYKWDNKNVRDYAAEQGREEGLKQGIEQGLKQGTLAEKKQIAGNLKTKV